MVRKVVLRIGAALAAAGVLALIGLMLTFTPVKLDLPTVEVGALPPASPPAGMSISTLPTGTYETQAAMAFRGGAWSDLRQFSMTALLVRHPKGNLLIDAGAGKHVDHHVQLLPAMQRKATHYAKGTPAAAQLAAGGILPADLAGVIPTHAHWDHISGLDDLGGVPVLIDGAGKGFLESKVEGTEVANSLRGVTYQQYEFEGGPYLGFPRSHDVWSDGSVVIVPATGHTPDSVVVFVNLPSGARYALVGDLVFQLEGLALPAEKPWMLRRIIGEDDAQVRHDLALISSASKTYPQLHAIPAHDGTAFRMIPVFPASAQ